MIEQLARVPVDVDYASEFRYRDPVLERERSADRHLAIRRDGRHDRRDARGKTGRLQGACDLQRPRFDDHTRGRRHDPDARRAGDRRRVDQGVYGADGRACICLRLYLGQIRGTIDEAAAKKLAQDLAELPLKIEQLLNDADSIEELSKEFFRVQDFLYLGRGINFPVALEGALKLKEISYIHAEGYPAGEMKHGPNALIDEKLPVVIVNTKENGNAGSELRYEKTHSNIVEVKARDGIIISVLTEGDTMSRARFQTTSSRSPRRAICSARSSRSCRSNCSHTTSPSAAAATSTSREIWRNR